MRFHLPQRAHRHAMRYIKTGVVFDYQTDDPGKPNYLHKDDPDFAGKVFAGPIKEVWRCSCGEKEIR